MTYYDKNHNAYEKIGRPRKIYMTTQIPYIIYNNRRVHLTDIMRLENSRVLTNDTNTTLETICGYIYEGAWVQTYVSLTDNNETMQLFRKVKVNL